MTTNDPKREPQESGYRGALPPKDDTLARPWVLVVFGIFVLILVLAAIGVPSRFIPEPTPTPVPSATAEPSETAEPSGSAEPSASEEASAEPSESAATPGEASAEASASAEPSGP